MSMVCGMTLACGAGQSVTGCAKANKTRRQIHRQSNSIATTTSQTGSKQSLIVNHTRTATFRTTLFHQLLSVAAKPCSRSWCVSLFEISPPFLRLPIVYSSCHERPQPLNDLNFMHWQGYEDRFEDEQDVHPVRASSQATLHGNLLGVSIIFQSSFG